MPEFYPENDTVLPSDNELRSLHKIVSLSGGGGGGSASSYSVGGNFSGSGSPEGVVTANKGATYTDTTNQQFYFKTTDGTNTGWVG